MQEIEKQIRTKREQEWEHELEEIDREREDFDEFVEHHDE